MVLEAVFVLVVVVDLLGTGYSRRLFPVAPARVDQVTRRTVDPSSLCAEARGSGCRRVPP